MKTLCQWCKREDDFEFVPGLNVCRFCAPAVADRAYKDLDRLPRVLSVIDEQGQNRDAIHARLMGAITFLREFETINNVWEYPKAKE